MKLLLSLGTNLGDRAANLDTAVALIEQHIGHVVARSSAVDNAPVGFASPHRFLNAAVAVETTLSADAVLDATQQIERAMGRTAKSHDGRYADRIIDIDLLLLGDTLLHTERLTLPHPRLADRLFVLEPLAEIAADAVHPVYRQTYGQLLAARREVELLRASEVEVEEIAEALRRLLPQLTDKAVAPSASEIEEVYQQPHTPNRLFLLRTAGGEILGTATLCLCTSPTGTKAWIEDVVVDASLRGRGYGRLLVARLVLEALEAGAKSVNLTSRPERVAANALYQSLGFEKRETNVRAKRLN